MDTIAVFLESPVSVFAPTAAQVARFRERLSARGGAGFSVRTCRTEADFLAALPETEVAVVWAFRQEWFDRAPRLRIRNFQKDGHTPLLL